MDYTASTIQSKIAIICSAYFIVFFISYMLPDSNPEFVINKNLRSDFIFLFNCV
jgi:hypothetical protein